jgi:hypothetical protein
LTGSFFSAILGPRSKGDMQKHRIKLILDTIESQVKLLKLELEEKEELQSPELLIEEQLNALTQKNWKIKSDTFVDYDPEYYEEKE